MHTEFFRICADYGSNFHVFNAVGQPEPILSFNPDHRPVVGDWVQLDSQKRISELRERHSQIVRLKSDGSLQVLAANVDQVWVFLPLDREPSLNRCERFCRFVESQGLRPTLILSKLDLCPNPHSWVSMAFSLGYGAEIQMLSSKTGAGVEALAARLAGGKTALLLGQSGVGKTSLVNVLCPHQQAVGSVRSQDQRGRHVTTARRLFPTDSGGFLLDIPGLRELSWEDQGDLPKEFRPWAEKCRYRNCGHDNDVGCALLEAAQGGLISLASLEHWQKLRRETAYQKRREDPKMAANSKARWKSINKGYRQMKRLKKREEEG